MSATSLPGAFLDEVIAVAETPSATSEIDTAIANGETALVALVTKALSALPKPSNVFLAMLLPEGESALETYAASIVAKYPADTIRQWILSLAAEGAKAVGG